MLNIYKNINHLDNNKCKYYNAILYAIPHKNSKTVTFSRFKITF